MMERGGGRVKRGDKLVKGKRKEKGGVDGIERKEKLEVEGWQEFSRSFLLYLTLVWERGSKKTYEEEKGKGREKRGDISSFLFHVSSRSGGRKRKEKEKRDHPSLSLSSLMQTEGKRERRGKGGEGGGKKGRRRILPWHKCLFMFHINVFTKGKKERV